MKNPQRWFRALPLAKIALVERHGSSPAVFSPPVGLSPERTSRAAPYWRGSDTTDDGSFVGSPVA